MLHRRHGDLVTYRLEVISLLIVTFGDSLGDLSTVVNIITYDNIVEMRMS